ncbi:MAG: hypothetical protein HJJLKODD_02958 [Phycisphaerae bacterium]|nr:hypothetical protein [Phycisphaerae bacterium]
MNSPPLDLKARNSSCDLVITWAPDHQAVFPYRYLREQCYCANCVDEWTRQPRLDPDSIPADLTLTDMKLVGHYAVQFNWSDGHNTGIYSWTHLRRICPCPACGGPRPLQPLPAENSP